MKKKKKKQSVRRYTGSRGSVAGTGGAVFLYM